MHGFPESSLHVRAMAHNALLVEGSLQKVTEGSHSARAFSKQFILPGPVKMDAVYSALSEDDVLTIIVPKNTALRITDKS